MIILKHSINYYILYYSILNDDFILFMHNIVDLYFMQPIQFLVKSFFDLKKINFQVSSFVI